MPFNWPAAAGAWSCSNADRGPRGASVRNFGMLWPVGQPAGAMHELALASRAFWLEVLAASRLWHDPCGSLHLAYHQDEAQVLAEFAAAAPTAGYNCQLLTPEQLAGRSAAVKTIGLRAALWSPTEICVDPRQVVAHLPAWLERAFGVRFEFGTAVTAYERPIVTAGGRDWRASRLFACPGDDLSTLYPEALAGAGVCALQAANDALATIRELPPGPHAGRRADAAPLQELRELPDFARASKAAWPASGPSSTATASTSWCRKTDRANW